MVLIKTDFAGTLCTSRPRTRPTGLLEGEGKVGRVARFEDSKDIARKKVALEGLIRDWIRQQDK